MNVDNISNTIPIRVNAKLFSNKIVKNVRREMGDGSQYTTTSPNILHNYQKPGSYTIKATAISTEGDIAEASSKIYIGENSYLQYQLSIVPSFSFKGNGIEYSFKAEVDGNIDRIIRTFNNRDPIEKKYNESVQKTFADNGTYIVNAKAYSQNELKAIASVGIVHSSKTEFAILSITNKGSLQKPLTIKTNLIGRGLQEVENIARNR